MLAALLMKDHPGFLYFADKMIASSYVTVILILLFVYLKECQSNDCSAESRGPKKALVISLLEKSLILQLA